MSHIRIEIADAVGTLTIDRPMRMKRAADRFDGELLA